MAWYRKDQWELLKLTAADSENIEDTYEVWEKQAIFALKELKKRGQFFEKVDFDVKQFNQWCKEENKKPDSKTRSEYVAYLLRKKNTKR